MKVTLESTPTIVDLNNGVQARLWQGHTESGIEIHAFITRIAVHKSLDQAEFERELTEHQPLRASLEGVYPARMFSA